MQQYKVTGMSCAACQARVEKAVSKVPGVTECSVSLLTNSMGVEGDAAPKEIINAVKKAGYGAKLKKTPKAGEEAGEGDDDLLKDTETPVLRKRLILSVIFLLLLMYLTMGHSMLGLPLPGSLDGNHIALSVIQMLLSAIVMFINRKFFINGFGSLFRGGPNMDTLVALGSGVSFGWSAFVFIKICTMTAQGAADMTVHELYHDQLYFESAAMIPALITVGKLLEAVSKGRTTDALKSLMKLRPSTAVILKDGEEVTVKIDEVKAGDLFVVRPGGSIPADGIVVEGEGAVNEAALTGESIPVDKSAGDTVSAATINETGFLKCRATRVGEDTTLSGIIRLVSEAAATKAPIARIADKVSGIFVPSVIGIAALVTGGWLLSGSDIAFALERGICVLVISCPCALGLATPVAIMVGNGVGAKHGILFKTGAALETIGRARIIALDKTGTLTVGEPSVTDILALSTEEELLETAFSLEKKSDHPISKAILRECEKREVAEKEAVSFENISGKGLYGLLDGKAAHAGNEAYIREYAGIGESIKNSAEGFASMGKTPVFFEKDGKLLGMIAVADVLREDSAEAVREIRKLGLKVVMLSGDNERTARAIGEQAGVDEVIAGVLPDGKEEVIRNLRKEGGTIMVGDGINDAPALMRADAGVAIGAGTDVAIDSADVVLIRSRLSDVASAISLSRAVIRNIHENLFWAFFYNVICIPLAAGLFTLRMNPMIGAAAMSLSSFTVCMNALRLNLVKLPFGNRDPEDPRTK
ncbi:MAG: heavy metal translocating P-type ATPase [Lachnospiraceae bacterium]|nr:heavy metal translocating P-type ATPase [Lachnospiraceae bacterium]